MIRPYIGDTKLIFQFGLDGVLDERNKIADRHRAVVDIAVAAH